MLMPACEIILYGDAEGGREAAEKFRLSYDGDIRKNEYGTPYLNDVFSKAQQAARNQLLCYVNCDIILTADLLNAVSMVERFKKRFLLSGRRWDLLVDEPLDFSPGWQERLMAVVDKYGRSQPPSAMDYFVFSKGLWVDIPPFALGRTAWDNWLVFKARTQNIPVIDASEVVKAVHQAHDYSHCQGGKGGIWGGPEAEYNLCLAGGLSNLFILDDATHVLGCTGMRRVFPLGYLKRRLRTGMLTWYGSLRAGWLKIFLLKSWRMFKFIFNKLGAGL
jgi:hypothetical protein